MIDSHLLLSPVCSWFTSRVPRRLISPEVGPKQIALLINGRLTHSPAS